MPAVRWSFAGAELDETARVLKVAGAAVALERKPMEVLLCLLRAEGELVPKEELFETVWAGRIVTDGVLTQAIRRIREVLGDTERVVLKTIHGFGFRLDAPIQLLGAAEEEPRRLNLHEGGEVPHAAQWELLNQLGTRPHHELWRAQHREGGRIRVFKFALNWRAERALKRELSINRLLRQHLPDHVLHIEDFQFAQRPWHIQSSWIPAGSLDHWLAEHSEQSLDLPARVELVRQVCAAMTATHALGVLHKDIKPGNLLVDETTNGPRLRLCDFGSGALLSRERFAAAGITVAGFTQTNKLSDTSGTPAYIAPEILAGYGFDERADIYSLGVLLYQLAANDLKQPLAPGWELDVPDAGLQAVINLASAGRREYRFARVELLAESLANWSPDVPAVTGRRSGLRRAKSGWALVVGAVLLASAGIYLAGPNSGELPSTTVTAAVTTSVATQRVAARPFRLAVADADQTLVLSGIYEAVITDLARFGEWDLVSVDRPDVDELPPNALRELGKELATGELIRGSIQQSGDQLRMNLQLVDLVSGATRWGEVFEGSLTDLFALQTQASQALAAALGASLSGHDAADSALSGSAYAQYLSTLAIVESENYFLGSPLAYDQALNQLDQVLREKPAFVDAYLLGLRLVTDAYYLSRMDGPEAVSRIEQYETKLVALGPRPEERALGRAMVENSYALRPDLAFQTLKPHRYRLRNRPDYRKLMAHAAWHAGYREESYRFYREQIQLNPLDFRTLINWADGLAFGNDPQQAYIMLREAQPRLPTQPEISWLAATFAYWATGSDRFLQEATNIPPDQSLSAVRLFEVALDGHYRRGDLDSALAFVDRVPLESLYTNAHQIFPISLIRAWLMDIAGATATEIAPYAQKGLDILTTARATSDSPGRMALASTALAMLGRDAEALARAKESLIPLGATQYNHQVANLALMTLGMINAEHEALQLLGQQFSAELNGDLCYRVVHGFRWHRVRMMESVKVRLEKHCASALASRIQAIEDFDARMSIGLQVKP